MCLSSFPFVMCLFTSGLWLNNCQTVNKGHIYLWTGHSSNRIQRFSDKVADLRSWEAAVGYYWIEEVLFCHFSVVLLLVSCIVVIVFRSVSCLVSCYLNMLCLSMFLLFFVLKSSFVQWFQWIEGFYVVILFFLSYMAAKFWI